MTDFITGHVDLGDKRRIKRGCMNLSHLQRRKQIIDHNSDEMAWINACVDALQGTPQETTVSDVLQDAATL